MKRAIKGIVLGDLTPNEIVSALPQFEVVDPSSLLVDEDYQRGLSERSISLIRRIIAGWDWARFKPPVVAKTGEGYEVIDGQHTAIAAASHTGILSIPVMVVTAESKAERAKAFVGHNRDRLAITQMQLHASAVAAGDEDALTVAQVCERAGVNILKSPPPNGAFKPGDTIALAAIRAMVNRLGAMGARKVLQVLADAKCAPITADGVKAVEALLHDPQYAGDVAAEDITNTVVRLGPEAVREAILFSTAHKVPRWRALAVILFRATRKKRRAAA